MAILLPANTEIPCKKKQVFTNMVDNQPNAQIELLQGERKIASKNKSLGSFIIPITPAPRGTIQIHITIDVDENALITVSANENGKPIKKIQIEQNRMSE